MGLTCICFDCPQPLMGVPDLSRFRGECCYCYRGADNGISVCGCGLSLCSRHKGVHVRKAGCSAVFDVREAGGDLGMEVRSEVLGQEEVEEVRERLMMLARHGGEEERLISKDEEVVCPHGCPGDPACMELGNVEELRCQACDVGTRLWACLSCGYIGCGRVQYGVEGNGHAKQHYDQTQHNVFVLVSSLSEESPEVFCYLCDSTIRSVYGRSADAVTIEFCGSDVNGEGKSTRRIVKCHGKVAKKLATEGKEEEPKGGKESVESPYVGISNSGNTCYISSVIHMIGHAVSKEEVDLEQHFEICDGKNPLECFFCQLMRVLGRMKDARNKHATDVISILDLVMLIWRDMPMFGKFAQQDAHEFLMFLLEKIREGEDAYLIPSITSLFEFEVGRRVSCSRCLSESVGYECMVMICTFLKGDIRKSVETFFSADEWDCECGGKKTAARFVTVLPKYLIIQIGRYSYSGNEVKKIKDKIEMKSVKLEGFMSREKADRSLVQKLTTSGYLEDDAKRALGLFLNDEDKARDFLERSGLETPRTDSKYRVVGCINHTGDNIKTGHYTWWVYEEERCYLVDDTSVLNSGVDVLEDGYIFLFK